MFEKEAEEYMHKDGTEAEKLLNTIDLSLTKRQAFVLINICKQCFKDGAEFGYNKANEEMQAQIEKMKADYDKLLDEKIELEDRLAESRECY